jgi:hypothetical protein
MKWREKLLAFLKPKCWYIMLLVCSTIYVFYHKTEIRQFKDLDAQNLVFILWLILLLMPLFSEMELFGIKLKKEVEKAKSEIKENIADLRLQLMDLKITNSVTNSIIISNPLATKDKLNEMLNEIGVSTSKLDYKVEFDVPEQSTYLFKVKLSLEKALLYICEKTGYEGDNQYRHLINHLGRIGILSTDSMKIIIQIQRIANRGIHGEILSTDYIDFVEKAFPQILNQLNQAKASLNYCTCPKCKYSGYAVFENVCPKCGFVSDD